MGFIHFFKDWSFRIERILKHVFFPFKNNINNKIPATGVREWFTDLFFYVVDIMIIPELHQMVNRMIKWNIRPLTESEIFIGKSIFGDTINFELVRIDDNAKIGTKKIALAYVSFNIINFRKSIKKEIFIHELMHIWQYQHFGSVYIGRAVKAQRSKEGYDYGGVVNLYKVMLRGGNLMDFNFEQQADIVEDYFKIMKNSEVGPMVKNIYEYFILQLNARN